MKLDKLTAGFLVLFVSVFILYFYNINTLNNTIIDKNSQIEKLNKDISVHKETCNFAIEALNRCRKDTIKPMVEESTVKHVIIEPKKIPAPVEIPPLIENENSCKEESTENIWEETIDTFIEIARPPKMYTPFDPNVFPPLPELPKYNNDLPPLPEYPYERKDN